MPEGKKEMPYSDFLRTHKREPKISGDIEEKKLVSWCQKQRNQQRENNLTLEKFKKLESINFKWNVSFDGKWEDMFKKYVEFKSSVTELNKRSDDRDEKKIGIWASHQKQNYKKGKLSHDKVKKLLRSGLIEGEKT